MLFMCQSAQLKISLKFNNQIRRLGICYQDDQLANLDQFYEINLAGNQKSIATHIKKNKSQMTCPGESNTKNQSTSATMPTGKIQSFKAKSLNWNMNLSVKNKSSIVC